MTTALVAIAWAGLEYWLGKTDKVKAGSTVELALNVGGAAVRWFLK